MITVCDHFFDGSPENYALLEEAYRRFPNCTFLEFSYDPAKSYRPFSPLFPDHPHWRHEWHNTGRWLSYYYAHPASEHLFFLDSDEIVDPTRFQEWLKGADLKDYTAYRFAMLWHFREAQFEASAWDDLTLMVNRAKISPLLLFDEDERMGIFLRAEGDKKRGVLGCDGSPMIRHYTGVRTREEMAKKLSSWGHHWERDWQALLKEFFSRPFTGKDFIRGYTYHSAQTPFDPLQEEVPDLPAVSYEEHLLGLHRFPHVIMVSKEEAFRRQLEQDFSLSHRHDH